MNNFLRYFTLTITPLVLFSCSEMQYDFQYHDEFDRIVEKYPKWDNCWSKPAKDIITYPEPWTKEVADTFKLSETKVKNTSTCGLIQSYFFQPWNVLGPWCTICSNSSIDGIQYFNDRITGDAVVNELFNREDALDNLMTTYIWFIQDLYSMQNNPGQLHSFEILLASKKMKDINAESSSNDLIVLCLKMLEEKKKIKEFNNNNSFANTRHIIVDILLRSEFEPFLSENIKDGTLERNLNGYVVCHENTKVEEYAKLYLKNEQK